MHSFTEIGWPYILLEKTTVVLQLPDQSNILDSIHRKSQPQSPTFLQNCQHQPSSFSLHFITMKTRHPKLKPPPRPLFSCAFFRHCAQTTLSPTATIPSPLPNPQFDHPPPPRQPNHPHPSSSTSSSSSSSQSFTQWKLPLSLPPESDPPPPSLAVTNLEELFHLSELQLSTGSDSDQLAALQFLERFLVRHPQPDPTCPSGLMRWIVKSLKDTARAKPASKILLALCLGEANRHVAVEAGGVGAVVELAGDMDPATAERALAALELMCTVEEGAAEVRAHALTVPAMVTMMGRMGPRGKEHAMSALSVVYGGDRWDVETHAPPEEVARAVALALQGESSARGRRKGGQLLKLLRENGRTDSRQVEK